MVGEGGPTGWVTTAFMRGGTCWGGIGWGRGAGKWEGGECSDFAVSDQL